MKTIILKIKKNKNPNFNRWDIKNGRKIHAEIYLLKNGEDAGRFQIFLNGLAFYRDSLEDAKKFIIEQAESFYNTFNFSNINEIKVIIIDA